VELTNIPTLINMNPVSFLLRARRTTPRMSSAQDSSGLRVRQVEVTLFTDSREIRGHLRLEADRLTDGVCRSDMLALGDAVVLPVGQDHALVYPRLLVARDEVLVISGSGPRGDAQRRHRTRPLPIRIRMGPYLVTGHLHAPPTVNALAQLDRRGPFIPLTDARIEYSADGEDRVVGNAMVIINRSRIELLEHVATEDIDLPDLPRPAINGPLVKDFTDAIRGS
jgi:hypothetical protein